MRKKIIVLIISIILFFGLVIMYGTFLIADEDRYGDLVYINQKVQDGDLIFLSDSLDTTDFNHLGVVEKGILGKVFVWDSYNTMKQNLFDWIGNSPNVKVKVYRIISKDLKFSEIKPDSNSFNYLFNSKKLKFITEN